MYHVTFKEKILAHFESDGRNTSQKSWDKSTFTTMYSGAHKWSPDNAASRLCLTAACKHLGTDQLLGFMGF